MHLDSPQAPRFGHINDKEDETSITSSQFPAAVLYAEQRCSLVWWLFRASHGECMKLKKKILKDFYQIMQWESLLFLTPDL